MEDIQGWSVYPLTKSRSRYLTGVQLPVKLLWWQWPQDAPIQLSLSNRRSLLSLHYSSQDNSLNFHVEKSIIEDKKCFQWFHQWVYAGNLTHYRKHFMCTWYFLHSPNSCRIFFSNYKLLNCWRSVNNGWEPNCNPGFRSWIIPVMYKRCEIFEGLLKSWCLTALSTLICRVKQLKEYE